MFCSLLPSGEFAFKAGFDQIQRREGFSIFILQQKEKVRKKLERDKKCTAYFKQRTKLERIFNSCALTKLNKINNKNIYLKCKQEV